jgi:hypothetical protein
VFFLLALLLSTARAMHAQDTARAAPHIRVPASVNGRVETPGEKKEFPVAGIMVTLHRVGPDSAGPVDSVRSGANGGYSIQYTRTEGDDAIYFAAAVYHGIAYFSAPLQRVNANGDDAEITVFDTTTKAVEFHVQGHHVVVSGPRPDGVRDIVEVWELSNDTTVTVMGRDSLTPVWSASLPRGATKITPGPGDVGADAIVARGERVVMLAPFGPGVKQLSYSYSLPPSRFPLVLPFEHATSVFEVLLEEPLAQVTGSTLRATASVTKEGRSFKRFLAQNVPPGQTIRIAVPVTTAATRTLVLAILAGVIVLAMAGALVRALSGRRQRTIALSAAAPALTESLLAAIAHLDLQRESGDTSLSAEEYEARRSALKAELTAALGGATRKA